MFVGGLILKLTFTIEGKKYEVETGNIKNFDLLYTPYGFNLSLDWWRVLKNQTMKDDLLAAFPKNDLIEVDFEIERQFKPKGENLRLRGVVLERRFEERIFPTLSGDPVLQRHYFITVSDYISAFWKQHYPYQLYVKSKMEDVLKDNQPAKPSALVLDTKDCKSLKGGDSGKDSPLLFLALGDRTGSRASFYDFVMWYLRGQNAGLYFDGQNTYSFRDDKKDGRGIEFPEEEGIITFKLSELPRYKIQIHNSDTSKDDSAKTLEVVNEEAVKGIEKDIIYTTAIAKEATALKSIKDDEIKFERPYLEIQYEMYPTVDLHPGTLYKFSDGSKKTHHYGKEFRMRQLRILARAESQSATSDTDLDTNSYQLHITGLLESKDEPHHDYPLFVAPRWPVQVEGKVVSDEGKDEETSYQLETNKEKSIDEYIIEIPLFKDKNKKPEKIRVSAEPNHYSGHFYFPLYKGERVLLDMFFERASVARYLDWRAKLPLATQGDQIFMGVSDTKDSENRTILKHVYEDKKPVFSIDRINVTDTQTIEISEGQIFIHAKEEKK